MFKIDRYLLSKFLFVFSMVFISVLLIFVVIDFVENVDDFINARDSIVWLALEYYLVYIPHIIYLVMPIIVLIASLFSVLSITRYNELTAIKASGISLYRTFTPLIIVGFILSVVMFYFNEYVVPEANQRRSDISNYQLKMRSKKLDLKLRRKILQDASGKMIYFNEFDGTSKSGREISVQVFNGQNLIKRYDGNHYTWINGDNWMLPRAEIRNFHPDSTRLSYADSLVIRLDGITPERLLKEKKKPEEMNYAELTEFIEGLRKIGTRTVSWEVARHSKIAYPFASFIILIFGATLASANRKSGPALGFLFSIVVILAYYFAFKFFEILGKNEEIPALLASWGANIVFIVLAAVALYKAPK
jgi:lipopolysaccharide export system permease protein